MRRRQSGKTQIINIVFIIHLALSTTIAHMESWFRCNQAKACGSSSGMLLFYSMVCLWMGVESWSYFYSNNTMSWSTARTWCQQHYTDMVAIQNKEEISYLNSMLPKKKKYYWIGIRKINDIWTWVGTNKTLTLAATNWAPGEPNNAKGNNKKEANVRNSEDCVEMYIQRNEDPGMWNDERCELKKTALCYTAACNPNSCQHGECVENINSHRCKCFVGFFGERCEHVVKCDELTTPARASISCSHKHGNFSYNTLCQYTCEEGYQPNLAGPIRCTASGSWSEQPPTCELVQCNNLSRSQSGFMECTKPLGSFSYQSSCVFSCEEGYMLVGSQSETLQCGALGHWNDSQPFCVAVKCLALPEVEHGTAACSDDQDMKFSYGHSCNFSCARGYRLLGAGTVTCTSMAEWSKDIPHCEAFTCQEPKIGTYMHARCSQPSNNLLPNTSCHFSCDFNFELQGASSIQCSEEGQWNAEIPTCKAIHCPPPVTPAWGKITCSDPPVPGTICGLSCNDGYELQGVHSIKCTQSGQWTSTLPTCTAVTCALLEAPVNGAISCSHSELMYESHCLFTCDKGHFLHGQDIMTCDIHGNWTSETPVCKGPDRAQLNPTTLGAAAGGALTLSALSMTVWLLKRLRPKRNNFDLSSSSDIQDPPQVYKSSIDSLI